jgi:hypothetical protein
MVNKEEKVKLSPLLNISKEGSAVGADTDRINVELKLEL